ncbi:type VI secretion system tube protein TssD [Sphingobacterium chungjuense]|uniref:type VI secretion system tube protein TssD n=1 Tax=Sphingobacterium chungjuense TaxID=2675553 RepID=UPI00140E3B30|nr:type VI secretion system tube protein TssD [Sphingobacterium chungjuense]
MKQTFVLIFVLALSSILSSNGFAQQSDNRTKIQLTITFEGKEIVTDLTGVSTSFSRNPENVETLPSTAKDTVKPTTTDYYVGNIYLGVDAHQISDDMLRIFSKKQTRFDGKITVVDTYARTPDRTITFKDAAVLSFSQQMSTYGESYGNSAMTFSCKEIAVNGIDIEQ